MAKTTRIPFRGAGITCICVVTSLPLVEFDMKQRGLIKNSIDIFQLGYRSDVGASADTHSGGGNTDVAQYGNAQLAVWREWGWTIQHRTRAQGFDQDHGHGFPYGCTHLSAGGRAQLADWKRGRNGLMSHGTVTGKWPVPTWKQAIKNHPDIVEDYDMPYTKQELFEAVWLQDKMKAPPGADPDGNNEYWKPESFLREAWPDTQEIKADLAALKLTVAEILAALKGQRS